MLYILFVHMHVVRHFFLGQVGKFGAIFRTDFIDRAHIRFPVQELAGRMNVHPLSFLVLIQPFFLELLNGHVQVFRYALQIFEGIGRRHGAAAVAAGQAVGFLPHFFINGIGIRIQLFGRMIFEFGKEASES